MSEAKGERERLVVDTRSARSLIGYEDPANTITATVQRSSFPERVIFTTKEQGIRECLLMGGHVVLPVVGT